MGSYKDGQSSDLTFVWVQSLHHKSKDAAKRKKLAIFETSWHFSTLYPLQFIVASKQRSCSQKQHSETAWCSENSAYPVRTHGHYVHSLFWSIAMFPKLKMVMQFIMCTFMEHEHLRAFERVLKSKSIYHVIGAAFPVCLQAWSMAPVQLQVKWMRKKEIIHCNILTVSEYTVLHIPATIP